jgi:hypothetical protein
MSHLQISCHFAVTDLPKNCDAAPGQRQAQDGLGYSDGFETEFAAKTQSTVTHEGHRDNWPAKTFISSLQFT